MNFHLKTYPDALRQLFGASTPEETNEIFTEALKIVQKTFALSGYRKGNVPLEIIEKSNPPELMHTISEVFLQKGMKHIESEKIKLYGKPKFHPLSGLSKNKEFIFSLVYEVYPYVEKAPDISKESFSYEECEIDQAFLEYTLCRQIGLFEETSGEIKEGDLVKVKVLNPEYKEDKHEASFEADKLNILIGKKTGLSLDINFDDLSGYIAEFLGKIKAPLKVEISEILRPKAWSKVTEEEITEKTAFKSKKEYAEAMQKQMEHVAGQYNETQKAESLTRILSSQIKAEIPKSLWLHNLRDLSLKIAEQKVIQSEIAIADIHAHKDIISKFTSLPTDSAEGVAFVIWLDEIAEKENIPVQDHEFDAYCLHQAQHHRISIEEFKKNLRPEDKMSIKLELRREKAVSNLIEKAKFTVSSKISLSEVLKRKHHHS
ncbi:MAG: trigger factor [Brevinemataceae bacterium]